MCHQRAIGKRENKETNKIKKGIKKERTKAK
jgi:hypothetical protein